MLTDHSNLATTILQEKFDPARKIIQVCHVSAGSWGPGNYAEYFRKYKNLVGTNDIIVVEVNSHDLWEDDPRRTSGRNVGRDIALPNHKPWCALWDGFDRYFLPRMRRLIGKSRVNTKVDVPKWLTDAESEDAKYNLRMLDEVYSLPWKERFLLIWRSKEETIDNKETVGEATFRMYAKGKGVSIIDVHLNESDFRDAIHPSVQGQQKIATAILSVLKELNL